MKNLPAGQEMVDSVPGSGRSHGEGNGLPTRVLFGEFCEQRSLVGYRGHKELSTIDQMAGPFSFVPLV